MSEISKETIKSNLEKGEFYFHPGSSTGTNHQVRVTAQNNAMIYLIQELNTNIVDLKKSIDEYRVEVKNYEKSNTASTKWISFLTVVMTILVLVQVVLMLGPIIGLWGTK